MKKIIPRKKLNGRHQRQPVMDLVDHIAAARDLREIARLLNDLIMIFGRRGILTKGPYGDLQKCSYMIFEARDKAYNLYLNQYPGAPDIYCGYDSPSQKQK
jgi:hypothetical protein